MQLPFRYNEMRSTVTVSYASRVASTQAVGLERQTDHDRTADQPRLDVTAENALSLGPRARPQLAAPLNQFSFQVCDTPTASLNSLYRPSCD